MTTTIKGTPSPVTTPKTAKTDKTVAPKTQGKTNPPILPPPPARIDDKFDGKKPASNIITAPPAAPSSASSAVKVEQVDPNSPLGHAGPIGYNGPISPAGPVGRNSWNPSEVISGSSSFNWEGWSSMMTMFGGPLSAYGPLGEAGPVGLGAYADVPAALHPGGSQAVLGPSGILGALGLLGPLGPTGATGLSADKTGRLHGADGKVEKTVDTGVGKEEVVEDYTEEIAEKTSNIGDRYGVDGTLSKETDEYEIDADSKNDEFVTIAALPTREEKTGKSKSSNDDILKIEVVDDKGNVVAARAVEGGPPWMQLKVPHGSKLKVRVSVVNPKSGDSVPYRLAVVGTGQHSTDLNGGKPVFGKSDTKVPTRIAP